MLQSNKNKSYRGRSDRLSVSIEGTFGVLGLTDYYLSIYVKVTLVGVNEITVSEEPNFWLNG